MGKAKTDSKVESASGGLVFEHFESVFNPPQILADHWALDIFLRQLFSGKPV